MFPLFSGDWAVMGDFIIRGRSFNFSRLDTELHIASFSGKIRISNEFPIWVRLAGFQQNLGHKCPQKRNMLTWSKYDFALHGVLSMITPEVLNSVSRSIVLPFWSKHSKYLEGFDVNYPIPNSGELQLAGDWVETAVWRQLTMFAQWESFNYVLKACVNTTDGISMMSDSWRSIYLDHRHLLSSRIPILAKPSFHTGETSLTINHRVCNQRTYFCHFTKS